MSQNSIISRFMVHEFILTECKCMSVIRKKELVLNYILDVLKIDQDNIHFQDTINIVKKDLNLSFFNR